MNQNVEEEIFEVDSDSNIVLNKRVRGGQGGFDLENLNQI